MGQVRGFVPIQLDKSSLACAQKAWLNRWSRMGFGTPDIGQTAMTGHMARRVARVALLMPI